MLLSKHNVQKLRRFLSRHCHYFSSSTPTSKLTKKSCIQLLRDCESMAHLKQIQAQIFRIGLCQDRETLNKAISFCADPSLGNFHYAQRIFDQIISPPLFVYNVMIKAFAKRGNFRKPILLFHQLREDGLWPDNFTYPFVLKSIGSLWEVSEGCKIHGFVIKTGLDFDNYVCNSLMDMYAQFGSIENGRQLFDEIPDRDVVSWNVMISGYVRCEKHKDAIEIFRRMQLEGNHKPDEATVVSTLSACSASKNIELGKEIHNYVGNEIELTTRISNALLDMYAKCGCLNIAQKIFDEMPVKNVICWTSIVSGYLNCGELDEARELFDRSSVKDVVLWTAMINGYVQFNRFDEAVALFRDMQSSRDGLVKPDKFTMVSLLTGCSQMGALEQGKWIHEYIKEQKFTIDAIVGTALIEMYAKCGHIEKSLDIFYELKEKDTACWTSIICGLAMNGFTTKALELFSEMEKIGARPDDITFIGVLSACSHGGLVEKGQLFFHSMKETYHIEPKVEHYGCLVDLLGRAGKLEEAEEMIEKSLSSENYETLAPLYGALLSGCRIHGNVEMGERIWRRLVEMGLNDSSIHTLLAGIYASVNRWEDVKKVRRKMKGLGVRKVPGCSSIEVDGFVYEFLAGDCSHPKMAEIYSVLERMVGVDLVVFGSRENHKMERENFFTYHL